MFERVKEFLERYLDTELELTGPNEIQEENLFFLDTGNLLDVTVRQTGERVYVRLLMTEGYSIVGAQRDFSAMEADDALEWIGQELTELVEAVGR